MQEIEPQHELDPEDEKRDYRSFLWKNISRGVLWLGGLLGLYVLAVHFLPDNWARFMDPFTSRPLLMLGIFFLSETLTGIIPLELFVIWIKESPELHFIGYVSLLSVLSYLGGILAFSVGRWMKDWAFLKRLRTLESFQRYGRLYRRWGGIVIVISALTPLPFALISFLSATFQFPFQRFLLYASSRFLRFILVSWFFGAINIS